MKDLSKLQHFPLSVAVLCLDCQSIYAGRICPACASLAGLQLVNVLDRLTKEAEPCKS